MLIVALSVNIPGAWVVPWERRDDDEYLQGSLSVEGQREGIKCVRCGRDWTVELEARVNGEAGALWQVMCSCGAELYAEGTAVGLRLVAGLERRPI
jgi:hypothetical protein